MDYNFLDEEDEPLLAAGDASRALVPVTRHDGFTARRRRRFLKTLRKTGCVRDACRMAEISDSAAYKARRRDPEFRALWDSALSRAGGDLETLAWQRAVEGIEEEVIAYGKVVGVRRRRDPQLFRMLLQASNPQRYGGQGFGSRKALEKKIRAEIEEEQQAEALEQDQEMKNELVERLMRKIAAVRRRQIKEGVIYQDEEGRIVPAGYVKAKPEPPAEEAGEEGAQPGPDRPDPEPLLGPAPGAAAPENPPEIAENSHSGPRIRIL